MPSMVLLEIDALSILPLVVGLIGLMIIFVGLQPINDLSSILGVELHITNGAL